jgi:tetratricopeptide (TPR) repeat protein
LRSVRKTSGKQLVPRSLAGLAVATLLLGAMLLITAADPARAEAEATKNCGRGEALEALGRDALAEQAYLEDLKTQDSVGCGQEHLEALGAVTNLCAVAEALETAQQTDKAKEAYVKVLESDPESECASKALSSNPTDKDEHWWSWAATAAKDVVAVVGFGLLALAGIGILIWVFLAMQMRNKRGRRRWPAKALLNPSLEVKSLDDTGIDKQLGPAVASLIRSGVKPRASGGIDVVTGHSALADAVKPLGDISAEAKAAVAVVTFLLALLPRRNYEAAGALQAEGEHGRGISIELMNDSKQLGATTLWGNDFEAPDGDEKAFQRLAVPAAAWLDHQIATAAEAADDLPPDPKGWALFKAGAAWQEEGANTKAKALYAAALRIDSVNIWATANLGAIEMRNGKYSEAEKLLLAARAAFEGAPA